MTSPIHWYGERQPCYQRFRLKFRDEFLMSTNERAVYYHRFDPERSNLMVRPDGTFRYNLYSLCGKEAPPKFEFFRVPPPGRPLCKGCNLSPEQLRANSEWRQRIARLPPANYGPPPF